MIGFLAKKILLGNKLRSAVPLIGIIIGVASIMGIFAISSGGEVAIKRDLASIADNRVLIGSERGITLDDLKLVEDMPIVEYVFSPDMNVVVDYENELNQLKIEGYTKKALEGKSMELEGNSRISGKEILIGDKTAEKLFGTPDVIGKVFNVKTSWGKLVTVRVAGVYKENLSDTLGMGTIYMDMDEYKRIGNTRAIHNLVITYEDNDNIEESTNHIIQVLSRKNYGDRYTVLDGNSRYRKIEKIKNILNMFLGAVGAVALIMGGLGVSNLLMNMVREMTPSIGILRTMGMSANNILKLFLLESTILSTIGGLIGIIVGCLGAYLVGKVIGVPSVYYIHEILMVFFTSVGMGIVFGSVPAWKAAKMEVVEALKI